MSNSNGTSDTGQSNVILKDAYESQRRTIVMQEERLEKSQQLMKDSEAVLKSSYRKLLQDFEEWWNYSNERSNSPSASYDFGFKAI